MAFVGHPLVRLRVGRFEEGELGLDRNNEGVRVGASSIERQRLRKFRNGKLRRSAPGEKKRTPDFGARQTGVNDSTESGGSRDQGSRSKQKETVKTAIIDGDCPLFKRMRFTEFVSVVTGLLEKKLVPRSLIFVKMCTGDSRIEQPKLDFLRALGARIEDKLEVALGSGENPQIIVTNDEKVKCLGYSERIHLLFPEESKDAEKSIGENAKKLSQRRWKILRNSISSDSRVIMQEVDRLILDRAAKKTDLRRRLKGDKTLNELILNAATRQKAGKKLTRLQSILLRDREELRMSRKILIQVLRGQSTESGSPLAARGCLQSLKDALKKRVPVAKSKRYCRRLEKCLPNLVQSNDSGGNEETAWKNSSRNEVILADLDHYIGIQNKIVKDCKDEETSTRVRIRNALLHAEAVCAHAKREGAAVVFVLQETSPSDFHHFMYEETDAYKHHEITALVGHLLRESGCSWIEGRNVANTIGAAHKRAIEEGYKVSLLSPRLKLDSLLRPGRTRLLQKKASEFRAKYRQRFCEDRPQVPGELYWLWKAAEEVGYSKSVRVALLDSKVMGTWPPGYEKGSEAYSAIMKFRHKHAVNSAGWDGIDPLLFRTLTSFTKVTLSDLEIERLLVDVPLLKYDLAKVKAKETSYISEPLTDMRPSSIEPTVEELVDQPSMTTEVVKAGVLVDMDKTRASAVEPATEVSLASVKVEKSFESVANEFASALVQTDAMVEIVEPTAKELEDQYSTNTEVVGAAVVSEVKDPSDALDNVPATSPCLNDSAFEMEPASSEDVEVPSERVETKASDLEAAQELSLATVEIERLVESAENELTSAWAQTDYKVDTVQCDAMPETQEKGGSVGIRLENSVVEVSAVAEAEVLEPRPKAQSDDSSILAILTTLDSADYIGIRAHEKGIALSAGGEMTKDSKSGSSSIFISFEHEDRNTLTLVKQLLEREDIGKLSWNLKEDCKILHNKWGIRIGSPCDLLSAKLLLNPTFERRTKRSMKDPKVDFTEEEQAELEADFIEEAEKAIVAKDSAVEKIVRHGLMKVVDEQESVLSSVAGELESKGVSFSRGTAQLIGENVAVALRSTTQTLLDELEQNPTVFETKMTRQFRERKRVSVSKMERVLASADSEKALDADALQSTRHLLKKYKALRGLEERLDDFFDQASERLHPQVNLQADLYSSLDAGGDLKILDEVANSKDAMRNGLVAEKGMSIVHTEFEDLEWRIFASYSEEPYLMRAFRESLEPDRVVAGYLFARRPEKVSEEQRQVARTFLDLVIECDTDKRSVATLEGLADDAEAVERARRMLASLDKVNDKPSMILRKFGHLDTMTGRKIHVRVPESARVGKELPRGVGMPIDFDTTRPHRQRAELRKTCSRLIRHGTRADVVKQALLRILERCEAKGVEARFVFQDRAQLVFETSEAHAQEMLELVDFEMKNVLCLPKFVSMSARTGVGKTWADAKRNADRDPGGNGSST
ncbi:hypothetical protein NDN08_007068 [Rhodosorus marinus]|uniref:DNA-directed DNA polymerase family A palm domain-containing protein n=1 Tax=Rhodosorus marinus TaxID=101924 RepID=A0AAV8UFF9_9RHOD|nr:hypothetical protein NDN08_007068 [Rhodosorus marinus]